MSAGQDRVNNGSSSSSSISDGSGDTEKNFNSTTDQLLLGLYHLTEEVSPSVRQFATCLLSVFFVVGLLLIVPALLQTAAAYVWAVQVRKEPSRPGIGRAAETSTTCDQETANRLRADGATISGRDRTLFLYRTLACVASLTVLVFSTLPQLVFVVARPPFENSIERRWGWCQVITFCDNTTRLFATYLIVVAFGLLFWNFLFVEIVPRRRWLTDNVFSVILRSSIPIIVFSLVISAVFSYVRFERRGGSCFASKNGLVYTIYLDFILTRFIPSLCIFVIGIGFLRWLPHNDYGVLYEPGLFFLLLFPTMCCELMLHTFHQAGAIRQLIHTHFANLMLVSYAIYQMAFSSTFVVATMRSVVTEIREEMRKRKLFFLGEIPSEEEDLSVLHGSKRRTQVINGMQRQFSVAFRWKPEFTAEEQRTVAENPKMALEASGQLTPNVSQPPASSGHTDVMVMSKGEQPPSSNHQPPGSKGRIADVAVLHYTILQQSADLKKQNAVQQSYTSDLTPLPTSPSDLQLQRYQSGTLTPNSSNSRRYLCAASGGSYAV